MRLSGVNKEPVENEFLKLDEKWGEQYPIVVRSWQENWDKLSEYTPAIRKLIYTTNTVEGYLRQIRTEEVDHATGKLGYNLTTISHKVWRQVQIIVILHPLGKVVKPHET